MAKKENRSEVTMRCSVCGFELRPVSKNKKIFYAKDNPNMTAEELELIRKKLG